VACAALLTASLAAGARVPLPPPPAWSLDCLVLAGRALEAAESDMASLRLSRSYMRWSHPLQPAEDRPVVEDDAACAEASERAAASAAAALAALNTARTQASALAEGAYTSAAASTVNPSHHIIVVPAAPRWQQCTVMELKARLDAGTCVLCDVRSRKDFDRSSIKGSVSVPAVLQHGSSLAPVLVAVPFDSFQAALIAKAAPGLLCVLIGPEPGAPSADLVAAGLGELLDASVLANWAELVGGYEGWSARFSPTGVPRQTGAYPRSEFDFWTASN